jgi:hypothetical protein
MFRPVFLKSFGRPISFLAHDVTFWLRPSFASEERFFVLPRNSKNVHDFKAFCGYYGSTGHRLSVKIRIDGEVSLLKTRNTQKTEITVPNLRFKTGNA